MGGAYRGTVTTTQAGITVCAWPLTRNVAETGPSETLSYQPSLSQKESIVALRGDPDLPGPPTTRSRPASSVRNVASTMSVTFALAVPGLANSIAPESVGPFVFAPDTDP